MKARWCTVLAASSLLLCVVTAGMCVRSRTVGEQIGWDSRRTHSDVHTTVIWRLISGGGQLKLDRYATFNRREPLRGNQGFGPGASDALQVQRLSSATVFPRQFPVVFDTCGVIYERHFDHNMSIHAVTVPYWQIVVLLAVLPVACAAMWVRRRQWPRWPRLPRLWVVSAVLAVACGLVWVRSGRICDEWEFSNQPGTHYCEFGSVEGRFQTRLYIHYTGSGRTGPHWTRWPADLYRLDIGTSRDERQFGFGWYTCGWGVRAADGTDTSGRMHVIDIPYWFLLLAAAVLPLRHMVLAVRQSRRRALGLCLVCGYDLRATSDRCPECGTPAAAQELIHGSVPAGR